MLFPFSLLSSYPLNEGFFFYWVFLIFQTIWLLFGWLGFVKGFVCFGQFSSCVAQ